MCQNQEIVTSRLLYKQPAAQCLDVDNRRVTGPEELILGGECDIQPRSEAREFESPKLYVLMVGKSGV